MALLREYKEIAYQWGIWKTEESPEELLALLPDPERYEQQLTRFSSPHRGMAVRTCIAISVAGGGKDN